MRWSARGASSPGTSARGDVSIFRRRAPQGVSRRCCCRFPFSSSSPTAAWRIARNTEGFPVDLPFGPFVTAEMLGTVIYWATFLLAMMRVAQALKLGHAYSAYLITFNWGTLFTSAIFALPLIPYSLGLYPETPALLLTLS